jgi:hypothetical protein
MANSDRRHRSFQEGLITALAVGGVFIIIGLVVVLTTNIVEKTNSFSGDLTTVSYPFGGNNSTISFVVPAHPAQHIDLFTAVMNFMLAVGILQIVILALRLAVHSRIGRIAETVGNMIFWLGGAAVANIFLLAGTLTGWFSFWAWIIMLIGASLVARGLVHFSRGWSKSPKQQA